MRDWRDGWENDSIFARDHALYKSLRRFSSTEPQPRDLLGIFCVS
jgi:hypothetical protein